MLKRYFKRLLEKNKAFILQEVLEVQGLMQLFMKHRNTGIPWTREEKAELKLHLLRISRFVPVLLIFLLPFGSFLLPFLAEMLDRRSNIRKE